MDNQTIMITEFIRDVENYLKFYCTMFGKEYVQSLPLVSHTEFSNDAVTTLEDLMLSVNNCKLCELSKSRIKRVFGEGRSNADIMLIGEAPSKEDRKGTPFVGAIGQLLTKILAAIQLSREEVYITNILKCHPPQNYAPLQAEQKKCQYHLYKQIELIQPKFILVLGLIAAHALLNTTQPMKELRGNIFEFKGAKVIVTYHPADLLRNPAWKRETWEDVQKLQNLYKE